MKTITFYSYKGGVGRTLALANIAKRISEFNKKVCILDFDLEAPGIPYKFKHNIDISKIKSGIVDYIYYFQETYSSPKSILDYTIEIKPNKTAKGLLSIIPSGNSNYQEYWNKLSAINWADLLYRENSQGVAFFLDLKSKIEKELNPDVLLIDARTGISEISGIPLSILSDEVVLVVSNNEENIHGIIQIINSLTNPNLRLNDPQPKITLVLSRIPYSSEPQDKVKESKLVNSILRRINDSLDQKNSSFNIEELVVLHSDRDLELKESFKIGYEGEKSHPIGTDYLSLFSKLTTDILTNAEIEKFNNVKNAEKYYNQFLISETRDEKLQYLLKAIDLNKSRADYYYRLSFIYKEMNAYKNAIKAITNAIKLSPKNYFFYVQRAILNFHFMMNNEMIYADYKQVLELAPNRAIGYFGYGLYYSLIEKYEDSLTWYNKAIQIDPDDAVFYNNRACTYISLKKYKEALKDAYKALSINPRNGVIHSTFAEINFHLGNEEEFFRNIEQALIFGIDMFRIIKHEDIYKNFNDNPRFTNLLEKYNKQDALDLLKNIKEDDNDK